MTDYKTTPSYIETNLIPLDLEVNEEGFETDDTPSTNTGNVVSTTPQDTTPPDTNIIPSGGGSIVKGFLKTQNFNAGSSGWSIDGKGNVEFNDGNFRGDITGASGTFTGGITATSGNIGGWSVNSTSIYTGTEDHSGYTQNAGDITIYSDGTDASIHGKEFYIASDGKLTCTSITATGTINAQGGYLSAGVYIDAADGIVCESGGFDVGVSGHMRGGQTDYNTGTGWWIGYDTTAYKLSIGNSSDSTKLLLWDGTDLIVNGSPVSMNIVFGDGSDGDVTISGNTTLTADMYYDSLTINNGVTLSPDGYRIFVKKKLTNNGTIDCSGGAGGNANNGSNAVGQSGGAGGSGGTAGTQAIATTHYFPATLIGKAGQTGGAGGNTGSSGANGAAGTAGSNVAANSVGVAGVVGAAGVAGQAGVGTNGGTAGGGSIGGTVTAPTRKALHNVISAMTFLDIYDGANPDIYEGSASSGAPGSSGGGGGATSTGTSYSGGGGAGGCGGSGAPGGIIFLAARIIVNTGTITVAGGAGGNGGNGGDADQTKASGGGGGGGSTGSGGSGGVLLLIYSQKTDSGTISADGGDKGATVGTGGWFSDHGSQADSGNLGTDGTTGSLIEYIV